MGGTLGIQYSIRSPHLYWPDLLHEVVTALVTASVFACFLLFCYSRSLLRISTKYVIYFRPNLIYCKALRQWIGRDQFLAVGTFFSRICDICGNGRSAILFVFTGFYKLFPPISGLIDLARRFISRLMLIVLSGTKSNRGIKFIPWLGRCNPRSALIAFPGTRAWAKAIWYPESSGFLVSGATPWGHQFNRFFWLVMPFLTEVEYQNKFLHFHWAIPHLFERLFSLSWENNRDCHITMPLSLKTVEV